MDCIFIVLFQRLYNTTEHFTHTSHLTIHRHTCTNGWLLPWKALQARVQSKDGHADSLGRSWI